MASLHAPESHSVPWSHKLAIKLCDVRTAVHRPTSLIFISRLGLLGLKPSWIGRADALPISNLGCASVTSCGLTLGVLKPRSNSR